MYNSPEEFLQHYGVKGMKWGVRKAARATGRYAKAFGSNVALNVRHPIINRRVFNENLKNSTKKERRRKLIVGYKTGEIEGINAKIKSQVTEKKRAKIQKDIDSLKSNKKNMLALKSRNGKPLFTEKGIDSMISALEANKSKIKDGSRKKNKNQAAIERGEAKAKSLREKFGDKYQITVDKKGKVSMKIGNETWKVG